jgi:hypothetical protein
MTYMVKMISSTLNDLNPGNLNVCAMVGHRPPTKLDLLLVSQD